MRRRRREERFPVPVDLREFRAEQWLVLVEGEPSPEFMERSGGACPVERWRLIQALRLWSDARQGWAQVHGWPGGTVDRLREQIGVRRAELRGSP